MAEVVPLFEDGGGPVSPDAAAVEAFDDWNRIAKAAGWPEARYLTDSRRTALRRAIRDAGGLVGWKTLLEEAAQSSFLTGKTARTKSQNWRFTLDWLLKPANFVKVLEGSYQDAAYQAPPSKGERPAVNWRARLEAYRPMGFWLQSDGPRPEEPGPHQAPADMITAWRQRTGAAKVILSPPTETAEERMRATVEMYRRHGREQDATRVEAKLLALCGPSGGTGNGKGNEGPSRTDGKARFTDDGGTGRRVFSRVPGRTGEGNGQSENRDIAAERAAQEIDSPPWADDVPEGDDYGAE